MGGLYAYDTALYVTVHSYTMSEDAYVKASYSGDNATAFRDGVSDSCAGISPYSVDDVEKHGHRVPAHELFTQDLAAAEYWAGNTVWHQCTHCDNHGPGGLGDGAQFSASPLFRDL